MQAQRSTTLWGLMFWALLASAGTAEAAGEPPRERGCCARWVLPMRPRAEAFARVSETAGVVPEFRISGALAREFVAALNAACRKHLGAGAPRVDLDPGLDGAAGFDHLGFAALDAVFLDCTPAQIVCLSCTALDLPWGAEPGRLVVGRGTGDHREQRFPLTPRLLEHYTAAGEPELRAFLQARALILPPSATVALDRGKRELVVAAEPDVVAAVATWLRVLGYGGGPHQVQVKLCLGTFATLRDLDRARITPWDEGETLGTVSFGSGEIRKTVSVVTPSGPLSLDLTCTYTNPCAPITLAWEGRVTRDGSELTWTGSTTLFAGQVTACALPAVATADGAVPAAMLRLRVDLAWPTEGLDDGLSAEVGCEEHAVLAGLPGEGRLIPKVVFTDMPLEKALRELLRRQWPHGARRPPLAFIGVRRPSSGLGEGAAAEAGSDADGAFLADTAPVQRVGAARGDYTPIPQRPLTFGLYRVSLRDCLDYMGKLTGTIPASRQGVLAMADASIRLEPLRLGVFRVAAGVLDQRRHRPRRIDLDFGDGDDEAQGRGEAPLSVGTPAEVARLDRYAELFFCNLGVWWPRGAMLHYDSGLGVLLVRSVPANLRRIQDILSEINESLVTAGLSARVVRVTDPELERALTERTTAPSCIPELWRRDGPAVASTRALCDAVCQADYAPDSHELGSPQASMSIDGQRRLDFSASACLASDRYATEVTWRLRFGAVDMASTAVLWDGQTAAMRLPSLLAPDSVPRASLWLLLRPSLVSNGYRRQYSRSADRAGPAEAGPPLPATALYEGMPSEPLSLPLTMGNRLGLAGRLLESLPRASRALPPVRPSAEPALARLARCPAGQVREALRFLLGPPVDEPVGGEPEVVDRDLQIGVPDAPQAVEESAESEPLITRFYAPQAGSFAVASPSGRLHACLPGEPWRPKAHLDRRVAANRSGKTVGRPGPDARDELDPAGGAAADSELPAEPFLDLPEATADTADDDGSGADPDASYEIDLTEFLRSKAGVELPKGSWLDYLCRFGKLRVHSTPRDHELLTRYFDAVAEHEGLYLLSVQGAADPRPEDRLETLVVRAQPFSVALPSSGPLRLQGQIAFGEDPLLGVLSYRIEMAVLGAHAPEAVTQGSIPLTVGVPAELSLPGPEPRTFVLNLLGLLPNGTRRPWPVLADSLAEQQAAQATPFARALRECRLPILAVKGLSAAAALRRLIEAWEAAAGAPPCNLVAALEYGTPGALVADWPAQSLAEALARFSAERRLPLEIADDVAYIGHGPVPSDRGLLLLPCPPDRLLPLPSGRPAASTPAIVGQLRRSIYQEPIDFGPCDRAWYLPGQECIYARGRLDFRLRLADIVERALLPASRGTKRE